LGGREEGLEGWSRHRLELEARLLAHRREGAHQEARGVAGRLLALDPINELAGRVLDEADPSLGAAAGALLGDGSTVNPAGGRGRAPEPGEGPREILLRWAAGREGEIALGKMSRLAERGSEEARALLGPMGDAEASLREGISALLARRSQEAEDRLLAAVTVEEGLLGGARSQRLQEALRDLAALLREEAARFEGKQRLRAAFDTLQRARAADPGNVETLRGLWRLEQRAEELAGRETDCRTLEELLELTSPERVARRTVEAALARCEPTRSR
jgi:tetratricopeptide (TPR) repeat protein